MFSLGAIAASGVSTGYSGQLAVGTGTDKFGTRSGFASDPNSTPPWQQAGGGTGTVLVFGGLNNIYVELGGTSYQIVQFSNAFGAQTFFGLLHPNQSDTSALASNLFTSITTSIGTLNSSDATVTLNSGYGNPNFKVTMWNWNLPQPNIIGTTHTTIPVTIVE